MFGWLRKLRKNDNEEIVENNEEIVEAQPYESMEFRGILKINDKEYLGCYIQEGYSRTICLEDGIGHIAKESNVEFIDECPVTFEVEFNVDCYYEHHCTQLFSL